MPADASGPLSGHDRARPRHRRKRWRWVALVAVVLLVLAGFVLSRPAVLKRMLEPALARAFGGEVVLDEVSLLSPSQLRVGSMRLLAPGWPGESAEVVRAEDITITLDRKALFLLRLAVTDLDFGLLRVRIAERSERPGEFNVLDLRPDIAGGDEPLRPMTVELRRIESETGTVDADGTYRPIAANAFRGSLRPEPTSDGTVFGFSLTDLRPDGPTLQGTWDERTFAFDAALGPVSVRPGILDLLPARAQRGLLAVDLDGLIRGATFRWSPGQPFLADLEVADLHLDLAAVDLGDRWSRFVNGRREAHQGVPVMRVKEGRIQLDGGVLRLKRLVGELASTAADPGLLAVPVELSLDLDLDQRRLTQVNWTDAAERDRWLAETLRTAGFELSLAIRGFDSSLVPAGLDPVLELPTPIARALEIFGVTAWKLDFESTFRRAPPTVAADGTLQPGQVTASGQCFLSDASAAYEDFRYPLHQIKGHLTFDQTADGEDRVIVDYITGVSAEGARVSVRGSIIRPGLEATADITVTAIDLQVNPALIGSFETGTREALRALFDRSADTSLRAAGLLGSPAEIESLRNRLIDAQAELNRESSADLRAELADEIVRSQRMLAARPFEVGGVADVEIRIRRTPRGDGRTGAVSSVGTVKVKRAGLLTQAFPYPLTVTKGTLVISDDAITLEGDGFEALTLDGGLVRIQGSVAIAPDPPDGTSGEAGRVRPNIAVIAADDRISPRLLAAIPPPRDEPLAGWPGAALTPAARMLAAVRLAGAMDLHGRVTAAADGTTSFSMAVDLTAGSIDVSAASEDEAFPMSLPPGLQLRDLSASLRIDEDAIAVRSLSARPLGGSGSVTGSGRWSITDRSKRLGVAFRGVPFSRWVIGTVAAESRPTIERLWEELRPSGTFDADIEFVENRIGRATVDAVVRPATVAFEVRGEPIALRRIGGEVRLFADDGEGEATFEALALDADDPDSTVATLSGAVSFGRDRIAEVHLAATGQEVAFESPIIAAALRAFDPDLAGIYASYRPSGRFSGSFRYDIDPQLDPRWSLTVEPRTLAADFNGARPDATFSAGRIVASAEQLRLSELDAVVEGGRIKVDASFGFDELPRRAQATFSIDAARWTPQILAFLPPPLSTAREELGFSANSLRIDGATIDLAWDPARGLQDPLVYSLDVQALADDARWEVGVPITEADGQLDLRFRLDRSGLAADRPALALTATLESPSLRVQDRLVTGAQARLVFDDSSAELSDLDIRFSGDIANGRFAGIADLDPTTGRYRAWLSAAGADLGPILHPRDPAAPQGGTVEAALGIEGIVGDVASRIGRGRVRVRNASIANSPVLLAVLQISHLVLPLSGSLHSSDLAFFVEGPLARFTQFRLASDSFEMSGRGSIDLESLTVALRLQTRGRLAVVSDLLGALSNQIFEIELTGPVDDPVARVVPLPVLDPLPRGERRSSGEGTDTIATHGEPAPRRTNTGTPPAVRAATGTD